MSKLCTLLALLVVAAFPAGAQTPSLVADLATGSSGSTLPLIVAGNLLASGGQLFFGAGIPSEPAVADAAGTGSRLLADLCPGDCGSGPQYLGTLGATADSPGLVLFVATPAARDGVSTLYRTDGTRAGTYSLGVPLSPGSIGRISNVAFANGRFFFTRCTANAHCNLWQTDGTLPGTGLVKDLASGATFYPVIDSVTAVGGKVLFFTSMGGVQKELWASDGTAAGTVRVHTVAGPSFPASLAGGTRHLYFVETNANAAAPPSQTLWASDGTASGTLPVITFPGRFPFLQDALQAQGDRAYFVANDALHGNEIWVSDGTPESTRRVTELGYGDPFLSTLPLLHLGSRLLFAATDGVHGAQLWTSTGTPESTALLPGPAHVTPRSLVALASGRVVFYADGQTDSGPFPDRGLWSTDGTPEGTRPLPLACTDRCSLPTSDLVELAGSAFFTVADRLGVLSLWTTDGTPAGTRPFTDPLPGDRIGQLAAVGRQLFFTLAGGNDPLRLWTSDGQPGGTRPVPGLDSGDPAGCQPGDSRLCLAGNRFQVEIAWKDFQGHTGVGHAVTLTADTGYFWFFSPSNVETVIKVLDGRSLNQAFWVFYGALSNVEYTISVTDTQTGITRRYVNPSGRLASVGDTNAFPQAKSDSKTAERPQPALPPVSGRADVTPATAAAGTCAPGPGRLCLQGGRFAVEAAWKDFQGKTGTGTAVPLSADTGYFWFFNPANVEVMTKVLDGTGLNGKFWLFYGALSNVEYTLTVTDTQTGAVKTYRNPSGQFGSVADIGAF
jgi:ELWxxDGT repeat protein